MSGIVGSKGLSLLVVWSLAASLLVGLSSLLAPPAAAQNCARSGPPQAGDWIIDGGDPQPNQVCTGNEIVMDGNLIIRNGGSLTVVGGGLKFVEDTTHVYGITVSTGGDLTLRGSQVWTETNLLNPYLKLTVTVTDAGSTLTLDNSVFAFPGRIDTGAGASVTLRNGSVITRTAADVNAVFQPALRDDNDDAPGLTFVSSTVRVFASRIESLYENSSLVTPDPRQAIRLQGSTTFTAVDSFLGVDFSNTVPNHNTLDLAGTSNAYLYGVEFDTSQNPGTRDLYAPAIVTAAGTRADLYRWADVRVVDANGVPVSGAEIDAFFSGAETGLATFRDSDTGANTPPSWILAYLGKTTTSWDDADAAGAARMPLLSEWIDPSTQPNSRFVGTFTLDATSGIHTGSASLTFSAYPAMGSASTSASVRITLGTLTLPLPDLTPTQPTFNPATPKEGQTVQITAPVLNQGAGGAADILVRVFDGVTLLAEVTIPSINPGQSQNVVTSLVNATAGNHVIRVSVDPNNAIIEGPGAAAESNNLRGFQLAVTPFGPDLQTDVSFNPSPGFLNNPVQLIAGVTNAGDRNATNVAVKFYVQGTAPTVGDTPVGSAVIPFIDVGGVGTASVNWTPTSLATFRVWAWADPGTPSSPTGGVIPEPAPYSEDDNLNFNDLTVAPAPDLVTTPQDLTLTDPFPRVGQPITLEATVRNSGQAPTGGFTVEFSVDGTPVGTRTNTVGLGVGEKWTVPPLSTSAFTTCGTHTIGIHVDSTNVVAEGALYELNNRVTTSVQVYPSQFFTWTGGAIDADLALSSSIEISGPVSVSGAQLSLVQDQDACGRYYIKVLSGGSLTLANAQLASNWPLVVFVAGGGSLTATGSAFNLDNQGKGVLHSKGTLNVRTSTVTGDVIAKGTSADFRGVTFRSGILHIDTAQTSRLWDANVAAVTTIQLASDAPGTAAVDFDLRNVTFNSALTSQLVFSGDQVVQLTSVQLTKPGDWWTGMLAQSAHVTRYWWLTVETVDGTGTVIRDATTVAKLWRFNPTGPTPGWQDAPPCGSDDCYFNTNNSWYVGIPQGKLLYRAAAEDRYGPQSASADEVRATYLASASANIEGFRLPDQDVSALVTADARITLTFSELTPSLSVQSIQFNGDNGANVNDQPVGRQLSIVATIRNEGDIISRGVNVYCYATDVDVNGDGRMDNTHAFYVSAQLYIPDTDGPKDIPAGQPQTFACRWTPPGTSEGSRTISVVIDPFDAIHETAVNETDNIRRQTITIFTWPNLHLDADPVTGVSPPTPIANNTLSLTIQVSNEGTNTADDAVLGLYRNPTDTVPVDSETFDLAPRTGRSFTLTWVPPAPGLQRIYIRVDAAGDVFPGAYRNYDFNATDNLRFKDFVVAAQPDLSVSANLVFPASPYQGQQFAVNVTVANAGGTPALDIVVGIVDNTTGTPRFLGAAYGVTVAAGGVRAVNVTISSGASASIPTGNRTFEAVADLNNTVIETDERNNRDPFQVTIQVPESSIRITAPTAGARYEPGQTIFVSGYVIRGDGTRVRGVTVTAYLRSSGGTDVASAQGESADLGVFVVQLPIPADLPDGDYTLAVNATDSTVAPAAPISVQIAKPVGFFDQLFVGLPVWIWLIIIIGAAVAIGGGTAYVKFVGLGKLVECGECGAFIPEDSAKCPKCGVEFEKDMAKCSNCQAWIPVAVKQCPECGVEFATGEVEMADYEAQMRKQYDEVKRKFREEASRELGRTLTDREFEDWWRAQPTFVTFEDWLREEEEMRRMGSKPCPVCNTLNSVTATVCHKCGTLLKEVPQRPGAGRPPAAAPRPVTPAPAQPPAGAPGEGAEAAPAGPTEAIPKKVVKKPVMGAPVVQKKVIKRPLEEEKKEGEGGEGTGTSDEEQI